MAKRKTATVIHLSKTRPTVLGRGTITTSLCGRFRTVTDGMNLTDKPGRVTCKSCLRKMLK